jgi:phenylacetate-CoA ligase
MNKFSIFLFDVIKQRKTLKYLNEFEKAKNFSQDELVHYQLKKLRKLLSHAEKNVPFYKQRFSEAGFSPNSINHPDQLKQIPPLTREDLQNHWKNIIPSNYNTQKLSKGSSSGSTGLPVTYFKDSIANSAGQAANFLGWTLSGWSMKMKGLHIWGNPSTVNKEWKRLSSRIKAKVFGHHKFPAYKLSEGKNFRLLYDLINNEKYDFIDGYTNAIYLFADYLKQNNLELKHKIKYVLTTAENLQDFQRKTIEEHIAPVYDTYGCSEINGIAYECEKCNSYHIIDPHVYQEFRDAVDNFGSRELIITDLDNYAFPLIRYKNDDLGIPKQEEHDCEIPFTQIKSVSGRQSDIIKLKDGGTLSVPSFFGSMLLKQINGLKQYQIEKIAEDLIYIKFVKTSEFREEDHQKIKSALNEYLGTKLNYKIRFLDKLESSTTGKFKLLVDKTQ